MRAAREKALLAEADMNEERAKTQDAMAAVIEAEIQRDAEKRRAEAAEVRVAEARSYTSKLLLVGVAQRDAALQINDTGPNFLNPSIPDPNASAMAVVVLKNAPKIPVPRVAEQLIPKIAGMMNSHIRALYCLRN